MAKAAQTKSGDADGNTEGESTTQYFRRIFEEDPKLLKRRSNAEVIRRWLADNPGETQLPDRVKAALANAKGALRQKLRIRKRRRKAAAEGHAPEVVAHPARTAPPSAHRLEALEEAIDDCLSLAKGLDREELHNVIKLLRHARNEVVWKIGQ